MMSHSMRSLVGLLLLCGGIQKHTFAQETAPVAVVNGKSISPDQLQLQFFVDQLPENAAPEARQKLVDQLVNRELIRQFLQSRKISADPAKLDHQMAVLQKLIASRGEQLDDVLGRMHLTSESARDVLALPLAWESYVRSVVTEAQIRSEWDAHRQELDGTRVHASQIVRTLKPDASEADWNAAEDLLKELREKIMAGKQTFSAAAEAASQSPSGKRGGDLGEFEYRGRVDAAISKVAFATAPGEISTPFRSRFGVHLVQTHKRIPGQLSLEDVRGEILSQLGKQLWEKQVQDSRQHAKIQIIEQKQP